MNNKASGIRIRILISMADNGQHPQIDIVTSKYSFLARSAIDCFEWLWSLTDHLGKPFDNFFGLTSEDTGLSLSISKKKVHKTKLRIFNNVVKNNGIIGLCNQGSDMLEFHRLLYMDMFTPMGFEKRM
jgi:hypothetical protein